MHELNEFQMNVTQRYENVTTIRLTLLPTHALVFVFFFSFLFSKVIIIFLKRGYTELHSFIFYLGKQKITKIHYV